MQGWPVAERFDVSEPVEGRPCGLVRRRPAVTSLAIRLVETLPAVVDVPGVDGDVADQCEEADRDAAQRPFFPLLGARERYCQISTSAEETSIRESPPNPIRAAEDAATPAISATAASIRL